MADSEERAVVVPRPRSPRRRRVGIRGMRPMNLAKLRRHAVHALVLVLAMLALGNGVGAVLLKVVERHPQKIAAWLSTRAGRPVAFDQVKTRWTRWGPLLSITGMRVGNPADPVRIGSVDIQIEQYSGLLPGHAFTEIRLRGLDLTLQRASNGQWQVRGLPGQQDGGDPLSALEHLGELQLVQARLRVLAPELGVDLRAPRIDVRMQVNGPRLRVGAQAWLPRATEPIEGVLDFNRNSGDGRVYAGSRRLDLGTLAGAFAVIGVTPEAGRGRLQAWGRLRAHRIVGIHADAALRDVVLRGTALAGRQASPQRWPALELAAVWTGTVNDWQLRVPRLRIDDGKPWNLDGLAIAGGQHYALRARRLQAAPLLRLAAISSALSPGLRHWVQAAKPDALLENVDVRGERGGGLQASAYISGFRFDPVGHEPGMRGVTGWLQGDQDGLRMRFDHGAQVAFDWPAGFGVVHEFHLDGEAVLWRDDEGWTVHTPGLHIDGGPLQARARGGITFRNDHRSPHLDIAADIGDTPVALAHGFWIHHLMPKATVAWLDAALRGGSLRQVHAIVAGDLADWPFRNEPGMAGAGVFRAEAQLENGMVKFQPDWPAAEHMEAKLSFMADGFTVNGRAQLAGVQASVLKAGIQRYSTSELRVEAETAADASRYLALLSASPLHAKYGEVIDNLRAEGAAHATFSMTLPLGHEQPHAAKVDGKVMLASVRLREQRWNLDFQQVQGQANYDQDGFVANALQVRSEGMPGTLSLRAGPQVLDPAQAFEARLQANLDIGGMLGRVDSLKWLLPHVRGRSIWIATVAVPRASGTVTSAPTPAVLQLHSNLVGTQLDLPMPLRKPAAQAVVTDIQIRLPLEAGDFTAKLGNLLALHARTRGDRTGLRIALGGEAAGEPPANGLLIGGNAQRLDALGWIGVLAGAQQASSLPLLGANIAAQQLELLGADFANATLWVVPSGRDAKVTVKSATINGSLLVPARDDAVVSGHFDRLYWPSPSVSAFTGTSTPSAPPAPAATTVVPPSPPATASADPIDPAKIPALAFDVDDLRIGTTVLGRARFRSQPTAAGLRLQEFSTAGSKQRIKASGAWLGRGPNARSELKMDVDSDDIGALLAGLGLGGQVAGGEGKLGVAANWRGGPDRFSLLDMEASLALDARDGRLLEVEPGAGRLLGLLGVAQLRRRLTLDFSDFFAKGFTFDRIKGDASLASGQLRSDGLTVHAPAADLTLRGSTDLRQQRFDQIIEVKPRSGGLLTAVGALAGGPVGAAVGAVANAVLDKPMRGIGAKTYRVTGPWASPKVETLSRSASAATTTGQAGETQGRVDQDRSGQDRSGQDRSGQDRDN